MEHLGRGQPLRPKVSPVSWSTGFLPRRRKRAERVSRRATRAGYVCSDPERVRSAGGLAYQFSATKTEALNLVGLQEEYQRMVTFARKNSVDYLRSVTRR